ncbi:hypothetical protein EVAR_93406_1 [Eumeta japonica]|uniref:Uncharacterized protein n=1 Tax=Eumeta variegata TaxID=151549 RepID=A0A4C1UQ58_EUMVA|nr:hypothetical protein EVAR_93406_1 [Eumeta japonica]
MIRKVMSESYRLKLYSVLLVGVRRDVTSGTLARSSAISAAKVDSMRRTLSICGRASSRWLKEVREGTHIAASRVCLQRRTSPATVFALVFVLRVLVECILDSPASGTSTADVYKRGVLALSSRCFLHDITS